MISYRSCLAPIVAFVLSACGDNATNQPTVVSTSPVDMASDVALNTKVLAIFDRPMMPLTAADFTVTQGASPVDGVVAMSTDGMSVTFAPSNPIAANTSFTATITTGAIAITGQALGHLTSWTFKTGTTTDNDIPTVMATTPEVAIAVPINTTIAATFSETMDPLSLNTNSFLVTDGATPVVGTISFGPGTSATFTPDDSLPPNTLVTATLTAAVTGLNGSALAAPFIWSFMTGTEVANGPPPVQLGSSLNFAILAKTAISTVPNSMITGDIGISPAAQTYLTGFTLNPDASNVFSTSTQVVGNVYAADDAVPTPINLTTAISDVEDAYTDAAGRPQPDFNELGSGDIGGMTLAPGLYKWTSALTIPTDVTIAGGANDVWIFETTGDLAITAAQHVILSGGAQAKNVFWQVAGSASIGATAHFEGILLCKTEVTLLTGATMNGRILAQTQVVLQQATVTQPAP